VGDGRTEGTSRCAPGVVQAPLSVGAHVVHLCASFLLVPLLLPGCFTSSFRPFALPTCPHNLCFSILPIHPPPLPAAQGWCSTYRVRDVLLATMAAVGRPARKYVAIFAPTVCVMLNWFEDAHITRRLCAGGDARVLVTRCFTTQRDALCWLTHPAYKEAVATTAELTVELAPAADSPSAFMAIATPSSRSCHPTSGVGLAAVLALVQDPSNGVCITATFATEPIAWEWLENNTGTALMEVVGAPWSSIPSSPASTPASPAGAGDPTLSAVGGDPKPSAVGVFSSSELVGSASSSSPLRVSRVPPPAELESHPSLSVGASACSRTWVSGRRASRAAVSASSSRAPKRPVPSGPAAASHPTTFAGLFGGVPSDLALMSSPLNGSSFDRRDYDVQSQVRDKRRKLESAPGNDDDQPPHSSLETSYATESVLSPPDLACLGSNGSTQDRDGKELRALLRSPGPWPAHLFQRDQANPGRGAVSRLRAGGSRAAASGYQCQPRSLTDPGLIGNLAGAGQWEHVCERLFARIQSAFISGGPGAGKSTLLRHLNGFLRKRYTLEGEVVVLAPTGTSAKTADGVTYHSFFGFVRDYEPSGDPAAEAARLLSTRRYAPIKARLRTVRAVLLDEVSLVGATKLDVMHELLCQSRTESARPCLWYAFGDFFQLGPVKGGGMAFTASCWPKLFGDAFLDLPGAFRQRDPGFIRAVRDARIGNVSTAVRRLVDDCWVDGAKYEAMKTDVFHLMPRHKDVLAHNRSCLKALTAGRQPGVYEAVDSVTVDPDRDASLAQPRVDGVSPQSLMASLADCVAPAAVQHCLHARVMITSNHKKLLGVCHGSVGIISSYQDDGTAVVRMENRVLPKGIERGSCGLLDAGDTWLEVACPPIQFFARVYSCPGALAVRTQVPFVLGWASTIHMSQSLSISRAVLDLGKCFEAGMVQTAISRVPTSEGLHIKSFSASRLYASPLITKRFAEWRRL